jgi:hypothetical protein
MNTFHIVVEKRNPYQSKNRRQRPEPTTFQKARKPHLNSGLRVLIKTISQLLLLLLGYLKSYFRHTTPD